MISKATQPDIFQLMRLINSAYRGEASKKGWTTEAELLDGDLRTDEAELDQLLNKTGAAILKFGEGNDIKGCVFLEKDDDKLYLGMLSVSPSQQGSGIGKELLKASEKYALKNGCLSIYMSVISVRHELISWYERHGYKKTGETKPFPPGEKFGRPRQPLEFIILEKTLARQ